MPVKSMSPLVKQAARAMVEAAPGRGAFVVTHPRYRAWLARSGLVHAEAFLELAGEIISGHANRHVMRVELASGKLTRVMYLKREHRVGSKVRWRNWRAGFGRVSRSEREAKILMALDAQALPAPQWIAYGQDARGRAFLLVDDLANAVELRQIAKTTHDPSLRREYAREIGLAIAECHAARITTPDLAAKHIFLNPETGRASLIDWPSANLNQSSTFTERAKWFAQLDASLASELASPRDRLRVLRAYCRRSWGQPRLREWLPVIKAMKARLRFSSSIRDQLCDPTASRHQRLVWLAENEALCVVPELAKIWPEPALGEPYYSCGEIENGAETVIEAPDDRGATLVRYRSWAWLPRLGSWCRGKPWRSPALKAARQLFRQQRVGQAAPRLLAFGQKRRNLFTVESFVLFRKGSEAPC